MTHVLIVYELIPEGAKQYLVPESELTAADKKLLKKTAGQYINSTEMNDKTMTACMRLSDWVTEKPEYCDKDTPEEEKCRFHKFLADPEALADLGNDTITSVIVTGIFI